MWLQLEQQLLDMKTVYGENQLHIHEAAYEQREGLLKSRISIAQVLPS
jgi:hypothetical protein